MKRTRQAGVCAGVTPPVSRSSRPVTVPIPISKVPLPHERSLSRRFSLLLFLFLVLSGGTYYAVSNAVSAKEYDSAAVNLAGRQRMLIQKYAREIDQALVGLVAADEALATEMQNAASQTADFYETTLAALLRGGEAISAQQGRIWIPPINSAYLVEHLEHVRIEWENLKKMAALATQDGVSPETRARYVRDIQAQTAKALIETDHVVFGMQQQSEAKLRQVEAYMACVFALNVLVVVGILVFVRKRIVSPLSQSKAALEREIIERKHAEQEARHAKDYAHNVIQSMMDMVIVTTPKGHIVTVNEATCTRLGYREASLIGQSVSNLFVEESRDGTECSIPHETRPINLNLLDRLIAQRSINRIEETLLSRSGKKIDVNVSGSVMRDDLDQISGMVFVVQDITESNRLRSERERFSRVIEDSLNEIFIFDAETLHFVNVNYGAQKNIGYTMGELRQMTPLSFKPEFTAASFAEAVAPLRNGTQKKIQFETLHQRKDGSQYPVEVHLQLTDDDAPVFVAIILDITERKSTETRLVQAKLAAEAASTAKSEFLANMSHEIRTPMTAILGFTENLLDPNQSESERLNCIRTVRGNGEYLLGLINDILDLSKIEAGKMTIEHKACQPCRIIADVASLMRVRIDAKGMPFNVEYVGAIPETIQTDRTRLRQILINLIGNAIKFTQAGAIRLVTRFVNADDQPCLQFDVIDTGCGMTAEQKTRLFQPFMQADASTTRKFGGTGLGLTISKRFAELLGGDITVTETALGVGSTFRVTITTGSLDGVKMLDDPASATVVVDTPDTVTQTTPTSLQGCRILLAEDNPTNQVLIVGILKKTGALVTTVKNGKLAIDAALAARDKETGATGFDCILMDMQMPVVDGYEATAQLRRVGYAGPIIALTANAMEGDCEKCLRAGCNGYATKPIDRTKLVGTIRQHVTPIEAAFPTEA